MLINKKKIDLQNDVKQIKNIQLDMLRMLAENPTHEYLYDMYLDCKDRLIRYEGYLKEFN